MNLSTSGNFAQGRIGSGYDSASLNRRDERFNFYLTYSYYQWTTSNDLQTYRPFTDLSDLDKLLLIMDQYSYSRYPNSSQGVDFFAEIRHTDSKNRFFAGKYRGRYSYVYRSDKCNSSAG